MGQVHAVERGLGCGAEVDLGRGAEADLGRGAEADLGCGALAGMGRGAVAGLAGLEAMVAQAGLGGLTWPRQCWRQQQPFCPRHWRQPSKLINL